MQPCLQGGYKLCRKIKIEIDRKEYSDSLFEFSRLGYAYKQASLAPSDTIAIEMQMVGVTLPTINIQSVPYDKDINITIGALIVTTPVDNRSNFGVGMFIRHYFGISYWD